MVAGIRSQRISCVDFWKEEGGERRGASWNWLTSLPLRLSSPGSLLIFAHSSALWHCALLTVVDKYIGSVSTLD